MGHCVVFPTPAKPFLLLLPMLSPQGPLLVLTPLWEAPSHTPGKPLLILQISEEMPRPQTHRSLQQALLCPWGPSIPLRGWAPWQRLPEVCLCTTGCLYRHEPGALMLGRCQ